MPMKLRMMPQPVGLGGDHALHRRIQALARAIPVDGLARGRAPPFGQCRADDTRAGNVLGTVFLVKRVDIARFPERGFIFVALALHTAHTERERDHDGPHPHRGEHQRAHHHLHHDIGVEEQGDGIEPGRHTGSGTRGDGGKNG
jgi:hypothetical protein